MFSLSPENLRTIYKDIGNIYRQDPISFRNEFIDNVESMNPKTLRIICYQLYVEGINLKLFDKKVGKVSNETAMVLLKYGFDLNLMEVEDLSFLLDVCNHLKIDLNHNYLHEAIRLNDLPRVQTLLMHHVNPNVKSIEGILPLFSAIESLELEEINLLVNLQIIKQLRRYGALIDNVIIEQIKNTSYPDKLKQALNVELKPIYSDPRTFYFSLDLVEDLVLLAQLDPNIIDDAYFPQTVPSFRDAINMKRNETIFVKDLALGWPYYISDTMISKNQECYYVEDTRPTADSPPNSNEAIENVPVKLTPNTILFSGITPSYFNKNAPTNFSDGEITSKLASVYVI